MTAFEGINAPLTRMLLIEVQAVQNGKIAGGTLFGILFEPVDFAIEEFAPRFRLVSRRVSSLFFSRDPAKFPLIRVVQIPYHCPSISLSF